IWGLSRSISTLINICQCYECNFSLSQKKKQLLGLTFCVYDFSLSGASVVAIDNKIEQAMDLVKSHLMFAVREEVEVLKEQIKDLIDRNTQLEQENTLLKTLASPEQIAQFQSQVQTGSPPVSVATTGPQNLAATTQPVSHNSFSSA
uniref:TSC22 domain family protein 1 n=1 Tax=Gadus morhua TaxID=8049 RepID=A0A8C5AI99_GADMO